MKFGCSYLELWTRPALVSVNQAREKKSHKKMSLCRADVTLGIFGGSKFTSILEVLKEVAGRGLSAEAF